MATTKKPKRTISGEKTTLVFRRIIDSELFQDEVKRIRKELNIPDNGYNFKKDGKAIKLPQRDEYSYTMQNFAFVIDSKYIQETKKIRSLFPVMNDYFSLLLRNYIYYNALLFKELERFIDDTSDICRIMEEEEEEEYFLHPDEEDRFTSIDKHNENVKNILTKHPISIRIRHDVSQRTLVDFIKKNWHIISSLQKKHEKKEDFSFKNSKTKINSLLKNRDDFLYKNRNLPRKKLWELLNKKYPGTGIEYASLGKIISRETKRRDKK